jgi:hypothetical protein
MEYNSLEQSEITIKHVDCSQHLYQDMDGVMRAMLLLYVKTSFQSTRTVCTLIVIICTI